MYNKPSKSLYLFTALNPIIIKDIYLPLFHWASSELFWEHCSRYWNTLKDCIECLRNLHLPCTVSNYIQNTHWNHNILHSMWRHLCCSQYWKNQWSKPRFLFQKKNISLNVNVKYFGRTPAAKCYLHWDWKMANVYLKDSENNTYEIFLQWVFLKHKPKALGNIFFYSTKTINDIQTCPLP